MSGRRKTGLEQIASAAGLDKATTLRLPNLLASEGFVSRDAETKNVGRHEVVSKVRTVIATGGCSPNEVSPSGYFPAQRAIPQGAGALDAPATVIRIMKRNLKPVEVGEGVNAALGAA